MFDPDLKGGGGGKRSFLKRAQMFIRNFDPSLVAQPFISLIKDTN